MKGVVDGVAKATSHDTPVGSTMKGVVSGVSKAMAHDTPPGLSDTPKPAMNKATTGLASAKKIDPAQPFPVPQVGTSDKTANLAGPAVKPAADKPVNPAAAPKVGSNSPVRVAADSKNGGSDGFIKSPADKPVSPGSTSTKEGSSAPGPAQVASGGKAAAPGNAVAKPSADRPVSPGSISSVKDGYDSALAKPPADKPVSPASSAPKSGSPGPATAATSSKSAGGKPAADKPVSPISSTTKEGAVGGPIQVASGNKPNADGSAKPTMDRPVSPNSSSKAGQSGMTQVASSNKSGGGGTTAKPAADKPVAPFESSNKGSGSSSAPVRVAANDKPSGSGGDTGTGVNKGMSSKPSTKLGQDGIPTSTKEGADAGKPKTFAQQAKEAIEASKSKSRPSPSPDKDAANAKTKSNTSESHRGKSDPVVEDESPKPPSSKAKSDTRPSSKGTPSSVACIPGDATVGRVLAADGSQARADPSDASILLNKYGPVIIGLLAGNLALMLLMSGLGFYVFVSRGGRARKGPNARTTSNYHAVKLDDSKDSQFAYAARYDV